MGNKTTKFHRGWIVLIGCCLSIVCTWYVPMSGVSLLISSMASEFGAGVGYLSSYFTVEMWVTVVAGVFMGDVVRKTGVRPLMVIGSIGVGVCFVLMSRIQNAIMFPIIGIFVAVFTSITSMTVMFMVLNNWFLKYNGFVTGLAGAFSGLGGVILAPVFTNFNAAHGWRSTFMLIAGVFFAVNLIASLLVVTKPEDVGLKPVGWSESVESARLANANAKTATENLPGLTRKEAVRTPAFILVFLAFLCTGYYGTINTQLATEFNTMGASASAIGTAMAVYSATLAIGKIIYGRIVDKWGITVVNICCSVITIISMLMFNSIITGGNPGLLIAASAISGFGLCCGSLFPTYVTAGAFGRRDFARLVAVVGAFSAFFTGIGSIVMGVLYDNSGSYLLTNWSVIIFAALAVPVQFLAIRVGRRTWQKADKKAET